MNRLSNFVRFTVGLMAAAFLALIIYVAVLGENHRVDDLVEDFFKDLKEGNYNRICQLVQEKGTESGTCADRLFLMETALLDHFGLIEQKNYSVVIFRDHFWIPFANSNRISLSISLTTKKKNMFEQWKSRYEVKDRIDGFMTVERKSGQWKITSVSENTPELLKITNDYTKRIDMDRYILKTEKGFSFQPGEIDFKNLSPADRRLFEYSLKKISDF